MGGGGELGLPWARTPRTLTPKHHRCLLVADVWQHSRQKDGRSYGICTMQGAAPPPSCMQNHYCPPPLWVVSRLPVVGVVSTSTVGRRAEPNRAWRKVCDGPGWFIAHLDWLLPLRQEVKNPAATWSSFSVSTSCCGMSIFQENMKNLV